MEDDDLNLYILQLQQAAQQGKLKIENGDIYRYHVTQSEFSDIVPEHIEDAIIDLMAKSGDWYCSFSGFAYNAQTGRKVE